MSVEVHELICGGWLFSYQQKKRSVCVAIQIVSLRNVVQERESSYERINF